MFAVMDALSAATLIISLIAALLIGRLLRASDDPGVESRSPLKSRLLRVGEVVIALTLILFTLPLMAFVCVAIKLESFGPVFCRRSRLDANGRFFLALKFRTTFYEQEWTPRPIRGWSPRETRVGRFLRQTRIEDLPQLVNVLRGETNLIPRQARSLLDLAKWAIWVAAAAAFGALYQGGGAVLGLLAE